jgi:hypothetical protein
MGPLRNTKTGSQIKKNILLSISKHENFSAGSTKAPIYLLDNTASLCSIYKYPVLTTCPLEAGYLLFSPAGFRKGRFAMARNMFITPQTTKNHLRIRFWFKVAAGPKFSA